MNALTISAIDRTRSEIAKLNINSPSVNARVAAAKAMGASHDRGYIFKLSQIIRHSECHRTRMAANDALSEIDMAEWLKVQEQIAQPKRVRKITVSADGFMVASV